MTIELVDKPGQLKDVSKIIADLGGNVVSIYHDRADVDTDVNACLLRIVMETRDFDHIQQIREAVLQAGYKII